jgi:protein-disulfide isomerase
MTEKSASSALSVGAIVLSLGVAGYTAWATQHINQAAEAQSAALPAATEVQSAGLEAAASEDPAPAPSSEASDAKLDREEIGEIIRDYLIDNPEVMLEVQEALEQRQQEQRLAAQQRALTEKRDKIFESEYQVEIGDENAPVTIVEFFDYNCGYCQRALDDMEKFVAEDPDVRFILKEFPVLGEASLDAHKVSIAFARQHPEKAADFHVSLLGSDGRKDGESALELAVSMGADRQAITGDLDAPYVMEAIREAYELADSLGITGTPSYVVGDEVVFGAVGFSSLNQKVAAIKECGKATC